MQKRNLRAGRLLWLGCAVIITGVPFHALFTAWFASRFGHFDEIRLWKEVILLVLAVFASIQVLSHPALRRDIRANRNVQCIMAFIAFIIVMTVVGVLARTVSWQAALYGLIIDTRSFVFLLVILLAGHLAPLPVRRRRWVLIPAAIVIGFGLLQLFILPPDFLRHFGYGPHALPAFQPVDNKPNLARLQSSLRGPNPLGAYLVPVIMSFITMALISTKRRILFALAAGAGLIVLFGSYSRSGALGLLIACWAFGYWSLTNTATKKRFLGVSAVCLILAVGLFFTLRGNDSFQNIAFHTNEKSTSASSSNAVRLNALKTGVHDIARQPLGRGVGSAGPASLRNRFGGVRISENYFVQIGQEAGIVGLVLFVAVLGALGRVLYLKRSDRQVRAALASLVGVIAINMVSHAFADDTLAYILFALLGFALVKTSTKPITFKLLDAQVDI